MDQQKQFAALMTQVKELTAQVQLLKQESQAKDARIAELENMNTYLTKKLYAPKSEKSVPVDANQMELWGENEGVFTQSEPTDEQSTQETQSTNQKRPQKRQPRQAQVADLPVKEKIYELPNLVCPEGQPLKVVGKKLVSSKLHFAPAKLWVEYEYVRTYACDCAACFAKKAHTAFYQADTPRPLFPHSLATPALLENIVYQKFVLGTPLYRQLKDWHRLGWQVAESTLASWLVQGAKLMTPLYNLIHQELLRRPYLQGDETVIQVLREPAKSPTSESRMWVLRTVQKASRPGIYYAYKPDRTQKSGRELYQGFQGVLQCDGYQVYHAVDHADRVGCLAHVRRKFYDAAKFDSQAKRPLKLLDDIFRQEKAGTELSSQERRVYRQRELRPLFDKFWECVATLPVLPKSMLGKAITYAVGQRSALDKLLEYGAFDLSNNTCEQAVKTLVIARKNFLFSTSVAGAQANAVWLTLIESAKANGLDPEQYLIELLTQISQLGPFPSTAELEPYLPWNQKQPKIEKLLEKNA